MTLTFNDFNTSFFNLIDADGDAAGTPNPSQSQTTGADILGESSVTEYDWSGVSGTGETEPEAFVPQIRTSVTLALSIGQGSVSPSFFGGTGSNSNVVVVPDGDGLVVAGGSSGFAECACPVCGGEALDPQLVAAMWESDAAPTTTGTITQLADYLRVTYWDDIGTRDPRQFDLSSGANNGILRYDLTGWTGTLNLDRSDSDADSNGIASAAHRDLIRDAFDWYGQILGITFIETESGSDPAGGTVDFFFMDANSGFNNRSATSTGTGGNIDYNIINISSGATANNSLYSTILHEIGHGLGLGHQGPYNGSASFSVDAAFLNDSNQLSNMSYFAISQNPNVSGSSRDPVTMQIADLHALNQIYSAQGYGPYANAFNGNTTYGVGTNITADQSRILNQLTTHAANNLFTLVDADGIDKVDFSNFTANQSIDLSVITSSATSGVYSSVGGLTNNMAIAVGTIIENATTGSGNDTLTGNQYNNELNAGDGNNVSYGGNGEDTLYGGSGIDSLYGGNQNDVIKGGGGADHLFGGANNDLLKGAAGDDILYAGSGVDTLVGDTGNDRIVVHSTTTLTNASFTGGDDTDVFEVNGSGTWDLRNSTLTGFEEIEFYFNGSNSDKTVTISGTQAIALGANARIDGNNANGSDDTLSITLTNTSTVLNMSGWIFEDWNASSNNIDSVIVNGSDLGDTITGGAAATSFLSGDGADVVYGGSRNDTMKGGAGADTLYGGLGSDVMYANSGLSSSDVGNVFYAGGGNDLAYGGDGGDTFHSSASASTSEFYGNNGGDVFYKNSATTLNNSESWFGGIGTDWLQWTNTSVGPSAVVNLSTGFITLSFANRDVVQGIENVFVENGAGVIGDGQDNWLGADGVFANNIEGGAGNDTLKGGAGADVLRGGLGVDNLYGGNDGDTLYDGDDLAGADLIYGESGNDVLVKESTTQATALKEWYGGDGNDDFHWYNVIDGVGTWIVSLADGRIRFNGSDRDVLSGIENVYILNRASILGDSLANQLTAVGAFANNIDGGDGRDTIDGGEGDDTLYGGLGDDSMIGGTGADGMEGGVGNDTMFGHQGVDTMLGQAGNDELYGGSDGDFVYGGDEADSVYGDGGADLLSGEIGNDSLDGGTESDTLYGGADNDTLNGESDGDSLYGDSGNDQISGGTGNDTLYGGSGLDMLYGDSGNDVMSVNLLIGDGWDHFFGGADTDSVFITASGGFTIDLAAGTYTNGASGTRSFSSIEYVSAGNGSDTITGSLNAETILGGGGSDRISGIDGGDLIYGGLGNDTLRGGSGACTVYGDEGNDRLVISDGLAGTAAFYGGLGNKDWLDLSEATTLFNVDLSLGVLSDLMVTFVVNDIENIQGGDLDEILIGSLGNNQINGGFGNDVINGLNGQDTLSGNAGNDTIDGGASHDLLAGGNGNDLLYGGTNNDTLLGENNADMLFGGGGDDSLDGGAQQDTLNGGAGRDTLIGGSFADTFVFTSAAEIGIGATSDRIEDFVSGLDKIDLTAFAGLSFINTTGFSGAAGELRYFSLAGVTYLAADLDGNSVANFEIILTNGTALTASDLILV